ncbi:MAG: VOC family protein [Hydrogenophilales bacterium]|nr:VOC family protein [Hydrogenophilales bacterium]
MICLDHLILRVRSTPDAVEFYNQVLGFKHVGRAGPFEVVRVSPSLTIDLMQEEPKGPVHLAFSLDNASFYGLHSRLISRNIPFGGDVFVRDGLIAENPFGARGLAKAFYFYDPDGHNLEARLYVPET